MLISLAVLALAFFFPLGQLGRISLFNHVVNFYLYEILFIPIVIFILFELWRRKLAFDRLLTALSIWFAVTFLMRMGEYSAQDNLLGFLYLLRLAVYGIITVYLPLILRRHFAPIWQDIMQDYLFIALILGGALQYLFFNSLYELRWFGWDPHTNRLVGTFLEPPIAGAIYGITFLWLCHNPYGKFNNFFKIIFLFMTVLTFARGVYVALGIITIYLFTQNFKYFKNIFFKNFKVIFSLTFIVIIIATVSQGESTNLLRQFTIGSRIENYQAGIKLWQEHWLTGVGYNRLRAHIDQYPSRWGNDVPSNAAASFHSSFLIILTTTGVVGLILFVWCLVWLARRNNFIKSVVIFLSILACFDNVLLHPFVLIWVVIMSVHSVSSTSNIA